MNVKLASFFTPSFRLTQCEFSLDIQHLSHFYSTYFKPAIDKHKTGDYAGAIDLYRRAIDEGSHVACYNLGNCYLFGVGVEKDTDKFVEYWERGGHIHPNQVRLFRYLSNIPLFSDSSPEPTCLFILNSFIVTYYLLIQVFILIQRRVLLMKGLKSFHYKTTSKHHCSLFLFMIY